MRALILALLLAFGVGAVTLAVGAPEVFAQSGDKKDCKQPC
jgi:hypothetical protein